MAANRLERFWNQPTDTSEAAVQRAGKPEEVDRLKRHLHQQAKAIADLQDALDMSTQTVAWYEKQYARLTNGPPTWLAVMVGACAGALVGMFWR